MLVRMPDEPGGEKCPRQMMEEVHTIAYPSQRYERSCLEQSSKSCIALNGQEKETGGYNSYHRKTQRRDERIEYHMRVAANSDETNT